LHYKKGVDQLLPAFADLLLRHPDALLFLAGPDDGYMDTARAAVESLGISERVVIPGMLTGRDRLLAFTAGDVFCLPSYSEGIAVASLEALACGLPAVMTPGCHLPEAVQAGAAVCVEPRASEISSALAGLLALGDAERAAMGQRGREMVASQFSWDTIARKMLTVYDCVATGREVPLLPEPWLGEAERAVSSQPGVHDQ
jgi:glycosyltransferase involved in cell wall biosynthesis